MIQKQIYKDLHGLILINKNKDDNLADITARLCQLLKQTSISSIRRLENSEQGLLVFLCGMAIKLKPYLVIEHANYNLNIQCESPAQIACDTTQNPVESSHIKQILSQISGDLELAMPIFFSERWQAQLKSLNPAQKLKKNQALLKKMTFTDLKIHKIHKSSFQLSISCLKQSYIQSWIHKLNSLLQVQSISITRNSLNSFCIKNSLSLQQLQKKITDHDPQNQQQLRDLLDQAFVCSDKILTQFSQIELTCKNAKILQQGKIPFYILETQQDRQICVNKSSQAQIIQACWQDCLLALLEIRPYTKMRILKNFF